MRFITIILALFSINLWAGSDGLRVEPQYWWVGMQSPKLQLMIHGDNIGQYQVKVEQSKLELVAVHRVDNPNYLFLDLLIKPDADTGESTMYFSHDTLPDKHYRYHLRKRQPDSAKRVGFNNSDVIYLITPDRFANGDASNDHIEGMHPDTDITELGMRHGGDIQGIIDNLDYIKKMGFSAIWICPMLESNQVNYSYHGYAITDYYKIDPRYGHNRDYHSLVWHAKQKGIKVIMDQVANHAGKNHWWSNDLPSPDWYHHSDKANKPITNHKRTVLADPYTTASEKRAFSDGWFVERMPDLNQQNPFLANYLIQNSIWWIEYSGIQGIRQDTLSYPDPKFMNEWSKRIMAEYPNFNLVGEEWSVNPAITSRWQRGKHNLDGFESHFPSVMDFPNQQAFIEALNKPKPAWGSSFDGSYEMLANDFLYPDPFNLVTFMDNHDMPRIYDQLKGDDGLFKMAMVYLYTLRGIPQVYYGTEINLAYPENPHDHGGLRIDMPGGWPEHKQNAFTGEGLTAKQNQAKTLIKTLNHYRTSTPALQNGKLYHFAPQNEIYVMFRQDQHTTVMSIFNKNEQATELDLSRFYEIIGDKQSAIDIISAKPFDFTKGKLTLPAKDALMLEIN
ncbi:glycoside hydrolase family 13 protein [Paraferrimonas sp. SM1919]|uniref:glycoside hydrolase family 13 protein n=1 Tax=Paraferrimonas sp. SM1919 TaxID=2662263 RepID=UPI0013D70C52|nr:glycoside hydrolase family 13 protein [Paraferrimonas sp. SM1919]